MKSYYKHIYQNQEKIPGVVVIVALLLATGLVWFMFSARKNIDSKKAYRNVTPQRIDVGNVRDKSLTLFWRTEEPTEGFVVYGYEPDNLDNRAYDEKDKESMLFERNNHVVTLQNLEPNRDIYYEIVINGVRVGRTPDTPFSVKTMEYISSPYQSEPLYGVIRKPYSST
jgi:hypothetical protein